MARIVWNAAGERIFEVGVDHGVLYVGQPTNNGVPWNGLIAVTESPSGGEVTPYYIDGVKYLNQVAGEEFQATIEAFSYPDEFTQCEGSEKIINGLLVAQQRRRPFGLTYRTTIGNDLGGTDYGYKIHIIYDALVSTTGRNNATIKNQLEPSILSWSIVTKAPLVDGYTPSSHFIIDSTETPAGLLEQIENALYGTIIDDPHLPTPSELIAIFENYDGPMEIQSYDSGDVGDPYSNELDGGDVLEVQTSTVDGGGV